MSEIKKALLVSGYSNEYVGDVVRPGPQARDMCRFVAAHHQNYNFIIMLGGMDSASQDPIGIVMKEELIRRGVPDKKIILPLEDIPGLQKWNLPRDTAEEVVLCREIRESPWAALVQCEIAALDAWAPRVEKLCYALCIPPLVIRVPTRLSQEAIDGNAKLNLLSPLTLFRHEEFVEKRRRRSYQSTSEERSYLLPPERPDQ